MTHERDKGAFSADIPADAIAEALAAVERRAPTPAGPAGEPVMEAAPPRLRTAEEAELEKLRAELELSQEQGRKVYEQLRDEHDRRLRAAADLENYKKRATRERDEVLRYGVERLVKELLPVLDCLDRALAAAPAGDPLSSGVELTRKMLEDALGRVGVKPFSAKGQAFDPRVHEALMSIATADHAPGAVVEEQQRGFFLHDRLIRPAAVVVAAAPAAPSEAPPAAGAATTPDEER
jgi:molecular chaperone GrpE